MRTHRSSRVDDKDDEGDEEDITFDEEEEELLFDDESWSEDGEETLIPMRTVNSKSRNQKLLKAMLDKPSSDMRKRKSASALPCSDDRTKLQLLEVAKKDAKIVFEEFRSDILASIPKTYKDMFGQIGFTKRNKRMTPVLIMSPFNVPPGNFRTCWLNMYEKTKNKRTNLLERMGYLIYWYGAADISSMFGFIAKHAFVPYKKEKKKGLSGSHTLPAKLQKLIDNGSSLNAKDKSKVRAYKEMEQDLQLEPLTRQRGVLTFLEVYDLLQIEDLEEIENGIENNNKDADADKIYGDSDGSFNSNKNSNQRRRRRTQKTIQEVNSTRRLEFGFTHVNVCNLNNERIVINLYSDDEDEDRNLKDDDEVSSKAHTEKNKSTEIDVNNGDDDSVQTMQVLTPSALIRIKLKEAIERGNLIEIL